MLCYLKTSFCTNEKKKDFWEKIHETVFKDEGLNEPTVNVEVQPRRNQRSKISKSFGPDFIAYAI